MSHRTIKLLSSAELAVIRAEIEARAEATRDGMKVRTHTISTGVIPWCDASAEKPTYVRKRRIVKRGHAP